METVKARTDAPIGLITEGERQLMGTDYSGDGVLNESEPTYNLGLSPYSVGSYGANVRVVSLSGTANHYAVDNLYGARPVVTLRTDAKFSEGTGLTSDPYVVGPVIAERTIS